MTTYTAIALEHGLDCYKIFSSDKSMCTARMLRDEAQSLGLSRVVAAIERLATHGCKYSYEDFDVLSAASSAIAKRQDW